MAVALVGLPVGAARGGDRWDGRRSPGGLSEAVEAEEAYVVARYAGVGQVGHDFAYHARELVAVPRAWRGEGDLLVVWVHVDDEVVVRRVGEHAGLEVHRRPAPVGEVALGEVPQEPLDGGVRVRTDRGVYEADKLVVTAGAWDGELLDVLDGLAVPERQVLAWLQPTRPERFRPDVFPVFNLLVDEGRFYGFPIFGVPGFKFGKYHHLEEIVDPEALDREAHDYDEQLLREFAERYFPDGCGPTMDLQTCMFTNTPDNHFVIDLHPDYEQVAFASPCSGHGYKFASVIGEIMADLAETGITRHDISLFRLDRLAQPSRRPSVLPAFPTGSPNGHAHEQNGQRRSFPRVPDVRPFW